MEQPRALGGGDRIRTCASLAAQKVSNLSPWTTWVLLQYGYYTVVMLDFLLDLIFPKTCVGCGKWGKYFCERCVTKIEYFNDQVCPYCEQPSVYGFTHPRCQKAFGLDGMFTLAHYCGPVREAVRKIKYRSSFAICEDLAGLIAEKYHYKYAFDYFVPIPLAPKRQRERGFNQAEKLARELARYLFETKVVGSETRGKKLEVRNWLKRTRETKPQFGLGYLERQKNVREAFAVATSYAPQAICLVDDVSTTGSTIFECAKVLKRAGAKKVWAICVARGG